MSSRASRLQVLPCLTAGLLVAVLLPPADGTVARLRAAEPAATAEIVEADDAASRDGEECTVEFTVRSARHLADSSICFLNSRKSHRDRKNFCAVIMRQGLAALAAEGIDDPADHYRDQVVRVHGTVSIRDGRPQIVVEKADQIELVEVSPSAPDS